ncbi:unnamed protein product [Prorocentrum cordatum]|uniref:Uncharacterized protein n=1 Tax=Prorocentrum cordatum TaxID=2364126 RepID=A0ABN9R1H6_9DINO|nr:unnamed protein product [Polarella glacialis]
MRSSGPTWSRPAALACGSSGALAAPPAARPSAAAAAAAAAAELFGHWADFLRPRKFSVRLDVKMKRGAAPYPRNPNRKKPIPKVKGIVRKLLDDWAEWMRRLALELLRESPSAALRACFPLAQVYYPLQRELLHVSFLACWLHLQDAYPDLLARSLETALHSPNLPPDILQALLNLAEFMDRSGLPLPIDARTLGGLSEKCHAYAKAPERGAVEDTAGRSKSAGTESRVWGWGWQGTGPDEGNWRQSCRAGVCDGAERDKSTGAWVAVERAERREVAGAEGKDQVQGTSGTWLREGWGQQQGRGPGGGPWRCQRALAAGTSTATADGGDCEFGLVGTAALTHDAPLTGPTLLVAQFQESPDAVDSGAAPEARSGQQMVQDASAESVCEQEFWSRIQEAHAAKQAEQWRAVQARVMAEELRLQEVRLRVERRAKRERAAAFLREQGFAGLNARRRRRFPFCGRFTYALHAAVRLNDASVVEVLVQAGADSDLEDSDKLTPLALAFKLNRCGSHDRLIILSADSVASAPPPPPPPAPLPPPPPPPPPPPADCGECSGGALPAACSHCTGVALVGVVCDCDCGDAA